MLTWLLACGPKIDIGPVPVETWAAPPPVVGVNLAEGVNSSVLVLVRAGAGFDPIGAEGLAHLVAQAVAVALPVDAFGAVRLGPEWLVIEATCPSSRAHACLADVAAAVVHPDFDEALWSSHRDAALQQPEGLSATARVETVLDLVLFEGHRTGHPTTGRTGVLPTLDTDDGRAFHAMHYRRATVVAGVVGPDDHVTALEDALADLPGGPSADDAWLRPPTPRERSLLRIDAPIGEEPPADTPFAMGQVLRVPFGHDDVWALAIGVAALDQRLQDDIAKADVRATLLPWVGTDAAYWRRAPTFRVEGGGDALVEALATIEAWHDQGLGDAEFADIRDQLAERWASPRRALARAVVRTALGADPTPPEALAGVLRAQVDRAIRTWMAPDQFQAVVVGSIDVPDAAGFGERVRELAVTDAFR